MTLANADLLPVPPERRTWNWWHIASLWIGMAICIPTYTLASGLVDQGWTWQAAVGAVVLGNVVVLLPIALNSRSEEHTSELQSLLHLVCRLLLVKKNISRSIATD